MQTLKTGDHPHWRCTYMVEKRFNPSGVSWQEETLKKEKTSCISEPQVQTKCGGSAEGISGDLIVSSKVSWVILEGRKWGCRNKYNSRVKCQSYLLSLLCEGMNHQHCIGTEIQRQAGVGIFAVFFISLLQRGIPMQAAYSMEDAGGIGDGLAGNGSSRGTH